MLLVKMRANFQWYANWEIFRNKKYIYFFLLYHSLFLPLAGILPMGCNHYIQSHLFPAPPVRHAGCNLVSRNGSVVRERQAWWIPFVLSGYDGSQCARMAFKERRRMKRGGRRRKNGPRVTQTPSILLCPWKTLETGKQRQGMAHLQPRS